MAAQDVEALNTLLLFNIDELKNIQLQEDLYRNAPNSFLKQEVGGTRSFKNSRSRSPSPYRRYSGSSERSRSDRYNSDKYYSKENYKSSKSSSRHIKREY